MKLTTILLSCLSLVVKSTKPKLCVDCKHFTKDSVSSKFGKCRLFPRDLEFQKTMYNHYLVTGIKYNLKEYTDFKYCSTARGDEEMCGEKAKFFEQKEDKPFIFFTQE